MTSKGISPPESAAASLEDSPLDLPVFSGIYHPRNYEGRFQGPVGEAIAWIPRPGKYRLGLWHEADNRLLDSVHFEVRGPGADPKDEEPPDSSIWRDENFFSK